MNIDEFKEEVSRLGVFIDDYKLELLDKYYKLLIDWNKKINLTSITDEKEVYLKHFYDSLTIVKVIDLSSINNLCDIGSGAGFPGVVIKIFFPHLNVTLVDSLGKRVNFLNELIKELKLVNIKVINVRAEEYALNVRDKYDLVTARAVSSFNVLLEYSAPLVKKGKYLVFMRGKDDSDTGINALNALKCSILKKECFYLPFEKSFRTICLIVKNELTLKKYPRRNSTIKKHPL